jgi:glycosyltransferase involved in cell wall biosynthesis
MRIAICWTDISGYMAACWRALAAQPGVSMRILCFAPASATSSAAPFDQGMLAGLDVHFLTPDKRNDPTCIRAKVIEFAPTAVLIPGWAYESYNNLVGDRDLARSCRFAMAMDTPLKHTWRQRFARLKIGRLLDSIHRVFVAGERAFQYAQRLGVPESKIRLGMYGFDYDAFAAAASMRPNPPPRRFLYAGRYTDAKGIDILLAAYAKYRTLVADPFALTCCGKGELAPLIAAAPGVTDRGFVQPADQPALFADHAAFVIASRYEPWGVVIPEALASAMPVICTHACGASVEMVRDFHTGLTVATDDPDALARALRWAHENHAQLPEMGRNGQVYAASHAAALWARRVCAMFED